MPGLWGEGRMKCSTCRKPIRMGEMVYPGSEGVWHVGCDYGAFTATMKPGGLVWDYNGERVQWRYP